MPVCEQPRVDGHCEDRGVYIKRRFYFDSQARQCFVFDYAGCGGNQNNFEDQNTCERHCNVDIDIDETTPSTTASTPG